MTLEERAKSLDVNAIVSLLEVEEKFDLVQDELSRLKYQAAGLKIQLEWYETQVYGSKSEKMEYLPETFQAPLGALIITETATPVAATAAPEKKDPQNHKKAYLGTPSYSGLRFDEAKVVMEDVIIPA